MPDLRLFGATSNLIRFKLLNSSTGAALTGLTSASAGLIISTIADNESAATAYTQAGSTIEAVTTNGTFSAPTATKCRFKEVDATNHPGIYEFQFADARFAVTNAKRLIISVPAVSGLSLAQADYEIELVQFNPFDSVRMGLTALPNAAAAASGGLLIYGTSSGGYLDTDGSGRMKVGGFAASVIDASSIASSAITSAKFAANALDAVWSTAARTLTAGTNIVLPSNGLANVTAWTVAITGNITGNLSGSVGSVTGLTASDVGAIKAKTDNLPSDPADASDIATSFGTVNTKLDTIDDFLDTEIAAIKAKTDNLPAAPAAVADIPTAAAISDAVWDEAISGHAVSGSTGEALSAAGSAGDPWTTALPGVYGAGTAGKILGDNLNATVSSRASASSLTTVEGKIDTIDNYVDTEVAAIKAKTDLIPASPSSVGDIPTANDNADALLGRNIAGGSSSGRIVGEALAFLRNKWSFSGTTLTVFAEDDTTPLWTGAATASAGADPISALDPV